MKICKICGKNELEVEFYKGNSSVCKECVKERVYQNHLKREAEKAKLEGNNDAFIYVDLSNAFETARRK